MIIIIQKQDFFNCRTPVLGLGLGVDFVFTCHGENHGNSWRKPRQLLEKTTATIRENHSNLWRKPRQPVEKTTASFPTLIHLYGNLALAGGVTGSLSSVLGTVLTVLTNIRDKYNE